MFEIGSGIGLVKPSPGSAPSAVPDAAIEALKDRERKGVVKPGGLRVGSIVRVIHGPCTGQIAACVEVRAKFVTIVISFFGSERAVAIDRRHVEAV
jgi:transcription antitermination factor NusG